MRPNVTIGVAGHIDHGKTTLTKALTNIETDRLIEEKKRKISIENGFAFLDIEQGWRAAVIDVPGHVRFIRQMIAGVAGIDLVLLVIAADEGVMPQTREHLDILRLLGIPNAMIVMTKINLVDQEFLQLVKDDIRQALKGTDYETAPFYEVDSLTGEGIDGLKMGIIKFAKSIEGRRNDEPFRLPIDDVFSLHGHGTIVRGTIFNGSFSMNSSIKLLPQGKQVRIKQLQVHHEVVTEAVAGQRVAVNIGGVDFHDVKRGNCLIDSDFYQPTKRLDVILRGLDTIDKPLKQRAPVTVHLATSSVHGRIVLFDRNVWDKGETVYAQLELDESIVTRKGDRFIVRRPTPVETLGGGEVINPVAVKHRFGKNTVLELEVLAKGSPEEWVVEALEKESLITLKELERRTHIAQDELEHIIQVLIEKNTVCIVDSETIILKRKRDAVASAMLAALKKFHQDHPLRSGMNRAEWIRGEAQAAKEIKDAASRYLFETGEVSVMNHMVRASDFQAHYPTKWAKRLKSIEEKLYSEGLKPESWSGLLDGAQLPDTLAMDFRRFLIDEGIAFALDDEVLIAAKPFRKAVAELKNKTTEQFSVQDAKEILGLSRKHLIPFLELCDRLNLTKREDNSRVWQEK